MTLIEIVQLSREVLDEYEDDTGRPPTRVERLARWVVDHLGSDPAAAATLEALADDVGLSADMPLRTVARSMRRRGRVR